MTDDDFILEALPDPIIAAMEVRDRWFASLPRPSDGGTEFVAGDLQAWRPGQTVRVAFLGGTTELYRDIEEATQQITEACNIVLDFGFDQRLGKYRTWRESDDDYTAEIRVSFDRGGYWSLVGTDSVDRNIVDIINGIGGRPNTRSLNLGGFTQSRPASWKGTTRHEFMHALAFHHEHQNFRGPCKDEFRWDDDPGYVPTRNFNGVFVADSQGRRPGIYTFLAGPPNNWSRSKVDHNLKTTNDPETVMGPFDDASVMLYRFPSLFYKTAPSPCAPSGDGEDLSVEDKRGLVQLYGQNPATPPAAPAPAEGPRESTDRESVGSLLRMERLREVITPAEGGLETPSPADDYAAQAMWLLQKHLLHGNGR